MHAFSYTVPKNFNVLQQKRIEENVLAHKVAAYCKLDHFHAVYEPIDRDFPTRIQEISEAMDGIQKWRIMGTEYELQATAQSAGINVLLSGFPGDELVTSFAKRYYLEYWAQGRYGDFFFKQMKSHRKRRWNRRVTDVVGGYGMHLAPDFTTALSRKWRGLFLRKPKYLDRINFFNKNYFSSLGVDLQRKVDMLPASFHLSLKQYQRAHISRSNMHLRTDNEILAGLRFHIDQRYPLADIRLLQYVLSLPVEQKVTKSTTRSIFRAAMKGYLPESVRLRDVKTAGVLQTTYLFDERSKREKGKLGYWQGLVSDTDLSFLDVDKLDKVMSQPHKNPDPFMNSLLIAQMVREGKLSV